MGELQSQKTTQTHPSTRHSMKKLLLKRRKSSSIPLSPSLQLPQSSPPRKRPRLNRKSNRKLPNQSQKLRNLSQLPNQSQSRLSCQNQSLSLNLNQRAITRNVQKQRKSPP